ncbi:class I SAM-dependent methyltransferase [Actibacterium sp. MT2.3-13A]|uniref:class I SAM-dependent methyltransferase n=1 Tax=Actibacterium sp. MT2.3-13A TaxID=2828332 RepID=UPI001BA6E2E4|nr:class I SAM-dependent methyltransferase [Actibacterium sp. MT2.3-13A]
MRPEDILPTYQRVAEGFARVRDKTLFERPWLDRMLAHAPGRRVLDLGCGPGVPIARYLCDRRAQLTGVDGAPAMVALFRANLPGAEAIHADMRGLDLGRAFDAILAWDSFFHLGPDDQRAMFPVFAAHAAPGAALMFTAGPAAGEPIGEIEGAPVYHCSLEPEDYRALLDDNGFDLVRFAPEDPGCRDHTVFLARRRANA